VSTQAPNFRRKIKTREELVQIIGTRPRAQSVIMCHGTFDIVHPGHIRHLMYAKSKADLLIASLTCDAHIQKANVRPFVPQQLRAMNLAALEVVDFVVIDDNPTPLENLHFIKPDFFAKGYEYNAAGVNPKTALEMAVLEQYGGEMIFTPGDVVYSSSAVIESSPPNLSADKLHMLMESEEITFADLRDTVSKFPGLRVHVLGDTIVDSYSFCAMTGGVGKTPTLSLKFENQVDYSGGAAIVAKHLRSAGAEVSFSTVLGDDPLKDFVLNDLEESGVKCMPVIDRTRPTTQKNVFITGGYRMLKVDKLDNRPISEKIVTALRAQLSEHPTDIVVFSDFRHGLFSRQTIPQLIDAIPAGTLKVGDSQVASRWGNILEFRGFDLITPNEREARFALGDQDSTVRPLAMELYKQAECKYLILKMGERGLITYRAPNPDVRSFFTVESFVDRLVDPVGAGDGLLAYATLGLAASKSSVIASILGSMSAAIACEHDGNQPVKPEQVLNKLQSVEKRVTYE